MKISKSKQELARIISENGGWRDGEFAAQDGYDTFSVWFFSAKPVRVRGAWFTASDSCQCEIDDVAKIPNWHQTVLSRAEYLHLHPAPDVKVSIAVESNTSLNVSVSAKPTIEQLSADYRNAKDCAERKQRDADDAKSDVDAKLKALELAGEALGLLVSPITEKQEPELVITDWLDLQVGDRIWVGDSGHDNNCPEGEYDIVSIDCDDDDQPVGVMWGACEQWPEIRERGWRFIRRP